MDSILDDIKESFSYLSDWVMAYLLWNIKSLSVRDACWKMTWFLGFALKYSREKRKNGKK